MDLEPKAIKLHCDHWVKRSVGVQTGIKADGSPAIQYVNKIFIDESDLYRLITQSRLPDAKEFEKIIFEEVIPEVVELGGYIPAEKDEPEEVIIARALLLANKKMEKLQAELAEAQPKIEFYDAVGDSDDLISCAAMGKLLYQDGTPFGRNRFFESFA